MSTYEPHHVDNGLRLAKRMARLTVKEPPQAIHIAIAEVAAAYLLGWGQGKDDLTATRLREKALANLLSDIRRHLAITDAVYTDKP